MADDIWSTFGLYSPLSLLSYKDPRREAKSKRKLSLRGQKWIDDKVEFHRFSWDKSEKKACGLFE